MYAVIPSIHNAYPQVLCCAWYIPCEELHWSSASSSRQSLVCSVGQQLLGIRCSSTRVVVADSEVPCAASEQRRTLPQDLDPEKNPFIHSFRIFLWHLFKSITTQRRSRHSTDTVPEFHTEVLQATVSEGLAQGPKVAARVGFNLPLSHCVPLVDLCFS